MWWSHKTVWRANAVFLLLGLNGCYGVPGQRGSVVDLMAEAVLPIECSIAVEPSGLCLRDGELYSVSDDTDDTIFRIVRSTGSARFEPALKFVKPEGTQGLLDLEGISVGPAGSFFLLSEAHARVLQVFPDGKSKWVTESVKAEGKALGFFRATGGGLEGLANLDTGNFLIMAERQPRGWLEVDATHILKSATMPGTRYSSELPLLRLPDFTGIDNFNGTFYVLVRNAELIITLERSGNGWEEGPVAWSFSKTVRDARWSYRDSLFGMAEGLAVDDDFFYIVIDNNRTARTYSAEDKRAMLIILRRP